MRPVLADDIFRIICSLDDTSGGNIEIPSKVAKNIGHLFAYPLYIIFNL